MLTVDPPIGALLTPGTKSVTNGSMGVHYLLWVINEQLAQFSSRNIDVRVAGDVTGPNFLQNVKIMLST